MTWAKFQTRVPGKWVLAGEHAVLKGAAAVAMPHPDLGLSLVFDPYAAEDTLSVWPPEANAVLNELLGTVGKNVEDSGLSLRYPHGKVQIESTIPVGAGLGSSAALCVALTQWVSSFLGLDGQKAVELATRLEDRFHGKSSGMDVAVISARQPIAYTMAQGIRPLGVKKLPKFSFHDTGLRSSTRTCIEKVEKFRHESPAVAKLVDQRMETASTGALQGLAAFDAGDHEKGLELISNSMKHARECFYSWELVPGEAHRIEENLLKQGALAVKLTGAGGGGMVVALWGAESDLKSV